jgi:hypothetical protein
VTAADHAHVLHQVGMETDGMQFAPEVPTTPSNTRGRDARGSKPRA